MVTGTRRACPALQGSWQWVEGEGFTRQAAGTLRALYCRVACRVTGSASLEAWLLSEPESNTPPVLESCHGEQGW